MTRVTTTLGDVHGHSDGGIHRFLGVPYAAAPIGPRRWRHPQPHEGWTGTRDATRFGPSAPQVANPLDGLVPGMGVTETDEDCLTLNIWTPDTGGNRPMLVWLHGGAFSLGGSAQPNYDGARLARRGDIVVASCNYRLGALGFLTGSGIDANCGIADQIAALRWLKSNAPSFGADPDRMTIFGESAGGGSVLSVLSSPRADGLVRRAIVQSGASNQFLPLPAADEVSAAFHREVSVAPGDRAALEQLDVETVLGAQTAAAGSVMASVGIMPWHPTDDGSLLPRDWIGAFADGAGAVVDLLIGTTRDEMNLFASFDPAAATLDEAGLRERIERLHEAPQSVLDAYRATRDDRTPPELWAQIVTDTSMWVPAQQLLDARGDASAATYAYRFDWPAVDPAVGACHGIDIPFAFDTIDVSGWDEFLHSPTEAHGLAVAMQDAWCAFAATGDPSTDSLPWPQYRSPQRTTMILGPTCATTDDPAGAVRRLWTTS